MRTPECERVLGPGEVVHVPDGEACTHEVCNDTSEPFRVLLASTKSSLYVAGYPESGKLNISGRMVRDSPELDYWDGEA